jgi:hypothetical protein
MSTARKWNCSWIFILYFTCLMMCTLSLPGSDAFCSSPSTRRSRVILYPATSRSTRELEPRDLPTIKQTTMMKESLLFHRPSALSDERSETRSRFGHVLRLARIALLSTAFAITSFSPRAWAITTIRHSISSIQSAVPWKSILKTALAVWTVRLAYSNYQVKKRQANLATSEWSRYARYPGARGRTILWLTVQQAILILASQIVRTRRSAIRQHAGHHFADSLLKLGPLYIKLGQIMSCRKNLLGPEWIEAMAT